MTCLYSVVNEKNIQEQTSLKLQLLEQDLEVIKLKKISLSPKVLENRLFRLSINLLQQQQQHPKCIENVLEEIVYGNLMPIAASMGT